jgi:hypothetical protein
VRWADHRVRAGGQREQRVLRSHGRDRRRHQRARRLAARGRRLRPVGRGQRAAATAGWRRGARRLVGGGRAQVAQRP